MAAEAEQLVRRIEGLLVDERRAIRMGDLGSLAGLAESKAALIGRLTSGIDRSTAQRLAGLKARADENQTLLSAALDGVRAARMRLDAIRNVSSRFDTYDSAGRAQSVSFAAGSVERRA